MKERVERFEQALLCKLTGEELIEHAQRLGELQTKSEELESEMATAKAGFKARQEALETERLTLSREIRDGQLRNVDCERIFDYDAGKVMEVRADTGQQLKSWKMTLAERQMEL